MKLKHWIQAARLRTLPLSVSGIILGSSLGNADFWINSKASAEFESHSILTSSIFWLCILTTISFQVLSNFANDYGDGIKGTDANRKGEKRAVASGDISSKAMKRGIILTAIIALVLSILTLYAAFGTENSIYFIVFIGLGLASIAAAIKYTVGENAYGYSGFGDVFVFLFFGLLSTVGSYFLHTKYIDWSVFLPAISIGLLSAAVLNLNNMRDREEDVKHNKITLAVKLGKQGSKRYHYFLILIALICSISFVAMHYTNPKQLLFLIAFVPLVHNIKIVYKNTKPSALDSELKKVAISTFLFAVLFCVFN